MKQNYSRLYVRFQIGAILKYFHIFPFVCFLSQLENIGNFVRAITDYGLKPHDIFEANDLFENVNHTQVQCTLIALAGMVRAAKHTHTVTTVTSVVGKCNDGEIGANIKNWNSNNF